MKRQRTYLCIDLKSFYASVECSERGLDPFTTNLVVADPDRGDRTICLAITPAMKELGIPNRCRLHEIPEGVDYLIAKPRMRRYMEVSAEIFSIYLRYISPEDIHAYSIDEVFIDATSYLRLYSTTPRGLAVMLMDAVLEQTGICATAGIGTNLFLAKVALDITAKHVTDHIGFLDQREFRRTVWHHRPITDIWNIGPGIAARLAKYGVYDLHGVCQMQEKTLYREFGVNAEYLIDHAHGLEPCTIAEIQAYVPQSTSLSSGQVLPCDYTFDEAAIVLREMVEELVLELVDKHLVAQSIQLSIGYSFGSVLKAGRAQDDAEQMLGMGAENASDRGGRQQSRRRSFPMTSGQHRLPWQTNSRKKLLLEFLRIYEQTTDRSCPIRRINIGVGQLLPEELAAIDLFTDVKAEAEERKLQEAVIAVKERFGKNALIKGASLYEKATGRERNSQVGGHNAD